MSGGTRIWVWAAVALAAAGGGGCAADVATTTAVQSGEAAEVPTERLAEVASSVPEAVCATEVRTIETAVAAVLASGGVDPPSIEDLAPHLSGPPRYHELRVDAAGEVAVAPIPGAGCD